MKTIVRRIVLALVALGLAVSSSPGIALAILPPHRCVQPPARVRLPQGTAHAMVKFSGLVDHGLNLKGVVFPGSRLKQLTIIVDWRDVQAFHFQRIELIAPDGAMYQRFTTAFAANQDKASVTTVVPVAGTSIVGSNLYGNWCAEVFLDDEEAPIVRRGFVLIKPR